MTNEMTNEEAIAIIRNYNVNGCGYCHQGGNEIEEAFEMAIKALKQEPKIGHWEYEPRRRMIDETDNGAVYREEMWCKCSECGADFGYIKNEDRYCKFCGAKMEVNADEEDSD
jgi:Zn finger protein HypA/HybF involved in hydrogenase expression